MSNDSTRRRDALGVAVAVGVALVLVILAWPRIAAPFGDSDEGINGAVWAANSRALRDDGPIESRLGGRRSDGTAYATHPPYIVVSTALAETVAGEHEWATRVPAWLGTLAAVALLYFLARKTGVSPIVAAAAAGATALTPMVFTYGFMLDTPVVSLPFGIAVLTVWYLQWRAPAGKFAWHPLAIGGLCLFAALAGWQAAILTGLAGVTLLVRRFRGREHAVAEAMPFLIGGVLGITLSLSWTWWVYGDFATLGDKFFRRSGESNSVGVGDMVSFQIPWLLQLLGLGIVGLGSCVAALWDRRFRPLAAMSLGIVILYAVIFRQAAAGHQYWNYWAVIPTAVGFAWAFDRLSRDLPARAAVPVFAIACLAMGVVNLVVLDDEALRYINDGREVAELVVAHPLPANQTHAYYVGQAYRPDAWLSYYTGRPPLQLASSDELDALAAQSPDTVVVVLGWCEPSDPAAEFCREVVGPGPPDGGYEKPHPRVETAEQLAATE